MNLSQMNVHLLRPMNTRNRTTINNWQIELRRKRTINTTLPGSSINQGIYISDTRNGSGQRDDAELSWWRLKIGVKSNINE